jgi:5-formyltetrahydrofolate cyclo-ligase
MNDTGDGGTSDITEDPLKKEKRELRRRMLGILSRYTQEEYTHGGFVAAQRIIHLDPWKRAEAVLLFMSMNGEIVTDPLVQGAFESGKRVYVPRVEGQDLQFYRIRSLCGPWVRGSFGIREPDGRNADCLFSLEKPEIPCFVLVPGLAFDRQGGRLGRGKGYYDRFLGSAVSFFRDLYTLGVGMDEQLVERVPMGALDRRLKGLCLGDRFIDCTSTTSV